MKIYVLTDGEYYDCSIMKVTTNRELAEALSQLHGWEIKEFEDAQDTGEIEEAKLLRKKFVFSFNDSGDIIYCGTVIEKKSGNHSELDKYIYTAIVDCDDREKAIEIARDMRAKDIAEKLDL